jgi:hypothetical protein
MVRHAVFILDAVRETSKERLPEGAPNEEVDSRQFTVDSGRRQNPHLLKNVKDAAPSVVKLRVLHPPSSF